MDEVVSSKELKHEDLVRYSNIFAAEFNSDSIHDRVLIFEVIDEDEVGNNGKENAASAQEEIIDIIDTREEKETEQEKDVIRSEETSTEEGDKNNGYETEKNGEGILNKRNDSSTKDMQKVEKILRLAKAVDALRSTKDNNEEKEIETKEMVVAKDDAQIVDGDDIQHVDNSLNSGNDGKNKRKLYVHSSWLSVQSSYFRALFYSGMQESFSKEVVMKVPKQELQTHVTLVEAMYNINVLDDKEFYLVVEVLLLADKYDVNLVFKKCKYVIMSTPLTLEKSEFIFKAISHIADSEDIRDAVCDFLVKEFSPLDKTWRKEEFRSLSKAAMSILLGSDKLVVQSENTVFVALMWWIKPHVTDNFEDVRSLLSLVRFKLISLDFMNDVVRHHAVAQKMDGFYEYLLDGLAFQGFSSSRRGFLKDKPTPRCSNVNVGPDFSWVIGKSELSNLKFDKYVCSSHFWVKGYKMHFQLDYDETPKTFELFLFVDNLSPGSHVVINWTAESTLFQKRKVTCTKARYCDSDVGYGCSNAKISDTAASSLMSEAASWKIDARINIE